MKKTLVSALTTALVVGAASTTFAAANPFEDVPADHWAYDAVAQLAADGVIEGYGDGTYRGDQEITRYEMAQMVARAMAKGANGADKALIDKLAAEFADELNNLGVRVSALEKKVDNVKWEGQVRYRYNFRTEEHVNQQPNVRQNDLLLRLDPTMQINKNWTAKARLDYSNGTDEMDRGTNLNAVSVDRAYVEGKYNNVLIRLGKFLAFNQADYGMTFNDRMAGGEVIFGKDVQVDIRAGRYNIQASSGGGFAHGNTSRNNAGEATATLAGGGDTVTYTSVEIYNDRSKKFTWGLGWQHVNGNALRYAVNAGTALAPRWIGMDADSLNIFNLGLGWKFDKNVNITGAYAWATGIDNNNYRLAGGQNVAAIGDARGYKQSAAIQVNYKGANKAKPGSWGAFAGYRHLGDVATIHSTYREFGLMNGGEKGWEVGVNYTFAKNILGKAQYYNGKELYTNNKVSGVWTELSFFF